MITESRLKDGTISLGTAPDEVDFSCQVINARVNTSYEDDGSAQETLCGDLIAPGRKLSGRSLAGTFIQDWTAVDSIVAYCYDHELEDVAFSYKPNGAAGPTLSGTVRVEVPAETYGGDVNTRITSDFEWQMTAPLTRTAPTAAAASRADTSS